MWKVFFLIFCLIQFNCSSTFESSKIDSIVTNQRRGIGIKEKREEKSDYVTDVGDDFEEIGLIGKWENNGDAIEPKWRDGDSVPLVPFDTAKKIPNRQRTTLKNQEESTTDNSRIRQQGRKLRTGIPKRLKTDEERRQKNILEQDRDHRGSFQVHPNEYELNDEEYQRPRPRKRRPPQNYEYSTSRSTTSIFENGHTAAPKRNRVIKEKSSENSELKSLLKMQQYEGLSLSEILQQKNLSLSDLLKGETSVLSALKAKNEDIITEKEVIENTTTRKNINTNIVVRPKLISSYPKRNGFTRTTTTTTTKKPVELISPVTEQKFSHDDDDDNDDDDDENLSTFVMLTKPILLPRSNPFTRKPITFEFEVTTISASQTEKYSKKEEISTTTSIPEEEEIMEFSDFKDRKLNKTFDNSKSEPERTTVSSKKDKASTLSIENIIPTTESTIISLPTTINDDDQKLDSLNTVVGFNETNLYESFGMDYQNDENNFKNDDQEKIMMGDEPYDQYDPEITTEESQPPSNYRSTASNNKIYEQIISEIEPEAREEILELISSGKSAQMLQRLLESRNMSIDELISLRQRGSSRVHLAQMNKFTAARAKKNRPNNNNQFLLYNYTTTTPKPAETTPKPTEERTPIIIDLNPRNQDILEKRHLGSFAKDSLELVDLLSAFDSLPFAVHKKENEEVPTKVQKNLEESLKMKKYQETEEPDVQETNLSEANAFETTIIDEETTTTTTVNYENYMNDFEDDRRKTLAKVRPSIVASGAILGMTIVVFLAIFIICRIRQKQRYIYRNTFARGVFQAPVVNARKLSNSSSLNTIMVNVITTSTTKRPDKKEMQETNHSLNYDYKCDIDNDSLDANDSWDTIPDFMK